ncbi:MAG: NAD(+) diphosphatase [Victivallales bacterium]|jgi:NAD+ diphosphatase
MMNNTKNIFIFRGNEILVESGSNSIVTQKPAQLESVAIVDSLNEKTNCHESTYSIAFSPSTPAPKGTEWRQVRTLLASNPESTTQPILKALALLNWRSTSRFCGRCGALTEDKNDEIARICSKCGLVIYPRLSPAILALVTKGDQILLARNAAFTSGIFSLIAGFLETGENFETCVRREVLEEMGIEVDDIVYLGSQPWPFPDSLMIGFQAAWKSGDIKPDGVEIIEAGWFSPDRHPSLPPIGSLSRKLIDNAFNKISQM